MSQVSGTSNSASAALLNQQQFLNLLVSQLQNQDPLDPVSDKDFITQLSQLTSVQSLQSLDANFSQVLRLQQLTSGTSLVGKTVTYSDTDGKTHSGKVSAVAVNNGQFQLTIGTSTIPLDKVTSASGS